MKLPSLSLLFSHIMATIKRFPFAILAAVIATIFCIMLSHLQYDLKDSHHWYLNVVMSCYIAMLLQIAVVTYSERKLLSGSLKISLQIAGVLLAVLFYYSLPLKSMEISNLRFLLFVSGLHLLIAFIPFTSVKEMNGFWQYNKMLFIRILAGALYTSVLYIGLALALLAVDKLFLLNVNYKLYGDLWFVLAGIFNTVFFLAGLPEDYASLDYQEDYPKGLKVFTQYVLFPIITIYLLILYAYTFKILFTLHWPVGWVSYLVLGFSVAGILSILLIHPIRNELSNKWILTFSKFFYFAIFPLLILLFFAIEKRVSDYGITELRYFVLVLALWLFFIATYFTVSKQKSIKVIPQSLCFLAFLCSFGPWGAFSVSLRSQQYHFEKLMERNKLLVNKKVIKATNKIPLKDRQQISSIVSYLLETHGTKSLQSYFYQNIDSLKIPNTKGYYLQNSQVNKLLEMENIEYAYGYEAESDDSNNINYRSSSKNSLTDIKGFDYYISNYNANLNKQKTDTTFYKSNSDSVSVITNSDNGMVSVSINKDAYFTFDIGSEIKFIESKYGKINDNLQDSLLTFTGKDNKYIYKFKLRNVQAKSEKNKLQVNYITGEIFIANRK